MLTVITGGAGFIGSHLTEHLLAAGDEVVILDDFSTGSMANLAHLRRSHALHIVKGSVLDEMLVRSVVRGSDRIFHLAAAVGVRRIVEQPLESLRTNLRGTENVLEAAAEGDVDTLVVSTSEVYGKNTSDALSEDADHIIGSPLISRWSYAMAKAIDEAFAVAYLKEYGLPVRIVRPFNTVGARQTGRYGMVLPNLVGQALRGEPLTVFGDGQQTRCFSSVHDIAPAIARIAESPQAIGRAVNLGGAQEISIMALAERVLEVTGSDSPIVLVPYEDAYGEGYEDMRRRVPDNTLAGELIGYSPRTGIDEMIRDVAGLGDPGLARADTGPARAMAGGR
ncbi:GDP-mannose 4,6-dehydratase [Microbacterium sp. X-17]|uniref:NAD-dependent epimerase/dehydratase family protein n=1 Tax=Microbacterium sp. X-17 TaxID=3144404 RepID=UPI0031F5A08E